MDNSEYRAKLVTATVCYAAMFVVVFFFLVNIIFLNLIMLFILLYRILTYLDFFLISILYVCSNFCVCREMVVSRR